MLIIGFYIRTLRCEYVVLKDQKIIDSDTILIPSSMGSSERAHRAVMNEQFGSTIEKYKDKEGRAYVLIGEANPLRYQWESKTWLRRYIEEHFVISDIQDLNLEKAKISKIMNELDAEIANYDGKHTFATYAAYLGMKREGEACGCPRK